MAKTWKRIPKLSEKPEQGTDRYYAAYRDDTGKVRRERFTKDRKESETLYRRWLVERYDEDAEIVLREPSPDKAVSNDSLLLIADAFLKHERNRVRAENAPHKRGLIGPRTA